MKDLRKLFHFIKPYWLFSVLSLLLLVGVAVLDLSIPRLIERIIDQGINQQNQALVIHTSLIMLGISVLDTIFAVGNNIYSVRVGESVARDLREAIFLKIQSFSYGDLDRFTTGKLMVRLSSDAAAFQRLVQITLRIGTRGPLMMIGSLILMVNTDSHLALILTPLLVVTAAVIIVFSTKMEPMFRIVQQKLDRLNTVLQENVSGVRVIKAFVRGDHESQRFEVANEELTRNTTQVMKFMSSMSPALTIFVNIGVVIVIWVGGLQSIQGNVSIGQIVAFSNYLLTTMSPLIMLTNLANVWANGIASAARINEVMDTEPEVAASGHEQVLPLPVQGKIEFKDVIFHYNGSSDQTVLDGVSLSAEPGQTIAILGATGAGKTSLVNLIPRFYDVSAGQVSLDGYDVRDLQEDSLLSQIAIVPQETILFTGTVRENIRYGRPNATDEEVVAAAKAAQAHDFIMDLPMQYDSHVEERGVNLSGGQKQRIAIARALITHPRILILDDSTSAVDVETETYIQDALNNMLHEHTRFVVAQRISTVLNADKILVIDKGRIVAQGTHSELLQSSPIYQEIYDSQLGAGIHVDQLAGAD